MITPLTRRIVLATALAATAVAVMPVGVAMSAPKTLTVEQAREKALKGDLLLLDIRTRQEWKQTGIGDAALPVSMHERSFLSRLEQLTGGDKNKPVALICATGGRSHALQGLLTRLGYANIFDVPAGMLGNGRRPGWIKSGLPVKSFTP